MHDLLREMRREITKGDQGTLWFHEDVLHVLSEQTLRT